MSDASVVVARPTRPAALVLLFHCVGSTADNMVPLASLIAGKEPSALVVSVSAAHPSTLGAGREWFSVLGVTEDNRPGRVALAMEAFTQAVRKCQVEAGVDATATTLVGFSQGAIMALESTQAAHLAARVVSLSGRFAVPPRQAPAGVAFRFIHGESDAVIDPRFSIEAAAQLTALGADATAQIVHGLAHGIDQRAAQLALAALR